MIRLDVYLERRAADLRGEAALTDNRDRRVKLLAESRELDRRAREMRKRRSDAEDVAIHRAWLRVFEAIDEQKERA